MFNFIQINLGDGNEAQGLLLQTAAELGVDVVILSKYYKYRKTHEK